MIGSGRIYPKRLVTSGFSPDSLVASPRSDYIDFSDKSLLFQGEFYNAPVNEIGDPVGSFIGKKGIAKARNAAAPDFVAWGGSYIGTVAVPGFEINFQDLGNSINVTPLPQYSFAALCITPVPAGNTAAIFNGSYGAEHFSGLEFWTNRTYSARVDTARVSTAGLRNDNTLALLVGNATNLGGGMLGIEFYYNCVGMGQVSGPAYTSPSTAPYIVMRDIQKHCFVMVRDSHMTVDEMKKLYQWGIEKYV